MKRIESFAYAAILLFGLVPIVDCFSRFTFSGAKWSRLRHLREQRSNDDHQSNFDSYFENMIPKYMPFADIENQSTGIIPIGPESLIAVDDEDDSMKLSTIHVEPRYRI